MQISRKDPQRKFLVEVSILNDEIKLLNTMPELDEMPLLEEKLRETEDLKSVLFYIRKLFVKYAKES